MKPTKRMETQPAKPLPAAKSGSFEIASSCLFGEGNEVTINHLGVAYRLRRTRNGKLLLYK